MPTRREASPRKRAYSLFERSELVATAKGLPDGWAVAVEWNGQVALIESPKRAGLYLPFVRAGERAASDLRRRVCISG